MGKGGPSHNREAVLEEVYASRRDLRDQPIPDADWAPDADRAGETRTAAVGAHGSHREDGRRGWLSAIPPVCSTGRIMGSNAGPPVVKR